MNKLLMEENDRLQKQISQFVYDDGYMKQQLTTFVCPFFLQKTLLERLDRVK